MPNSTISNSTLDTQRFFYRYGSTDDAIRQRFAVDQFQHQKLRLVLCGEVVNGGDIGMVQGRQNLGVTLKPGQSGRIAGEFVGQNLDGNFTLQLLIFGAIDLAESALTEQFGDFIRRELRTDRARHFGAYFTSIGRECRSG
jgi:hypothetical protein